MKRITVDLVMSFDPCYDRETVSKLFAGKKWMLPTTVLKLDTVSAEDKIWLLCRNEFVSEQNLRLFACDCAERVLPIFEKEYPEDNRPRKAIETARLFANGEATQKEMDAAWAAARAAAWEATQKEMDAAWAAARDAAWAAAWAAARAAAREATQKEMDAAWAAARDAAWAAARDARAAGAAAWDAEQKWQINKLSEYLGG